VRSPGRGEASERRCASCVLRTLKMRFHNIRCASLQPTRQPSQIFGVEPSGANAMAMSLAKGARVTLSKVDGFADGVAVKHVRYLGIWH
jgi:hypothetical protein